MGDDRIQVSLSVVEIRVEFRVEPNPARQFSGRALDADRRDSVAVMNVQEIGKRHFPYAKIGRITWNRALDGCVGEAISDNCTNRASSKWISILISHLWVTPVAAFSAEKC
jgi:hypothetical protein